MFNPQKDSVTDYMTTKGDIIVYTGTAPVRQAVGSDGQVMVADSSQTNGIKWTTANSGSKNYFVYNSFENNATTGWSLGTATLTNAFPSGTPTFGSGASVNLSLASVAGAVVAGTYAMSYVSSAATTAGNFVASDAFTIDNEDQAKMLSFSFSYKAQVNTANWSGTSSNSFGVAIYDVTNSAWIQPAGCYNLVQSTGIGKATGTFQTTSNSTSYRLCIFNANATTGANTVYFDSMFLGPQVSSMGAPISDWVQYTPTITGFGTVTTPVFLSRRVGDTLQVRGHFISGTSTAVTAQITLGYNGVNANVTIDSSKNLGEPFGKLTVGTSSTTLFDWAVLPNGGSTYFWVGVQSSTTNALSAALGSSIASSGQTVAFYGEAPISGWSSNTIQSSDAAVNVVAARMYGATASIIGSYSDVAWSTVANDSNGAFSTPNYTTPISGFYDFTGQLALSATSISAGNAISVALYNTTTSTLVEESQSVYYGTSTVTQNISFSYRSIYLNAGTQVKIRIAANSNIPVIVASNTLNFLAISRASGPVTVQASESVTMKYTNSAGTAYSATTVNFTVPFATKVYDSHNAFSSNIFTAPISGRYRITSQVSPIYTSVSAGNDIHDLFIITTGTLDTTGTWARSYYPGNAPNSSINSFCVSNTYYLLAGETLKITATASYSAGAVSLHTDARMNYISIERVGN